ncbi:MAG TPA: SCO family protein [Tepidisphaeraceae bacterium]|nr:SCO family protein [Tepidisphaeraceae bacterium]
MTSPTRFTSRAWVWAAAALALACSARLEAVAQSALSKPYMAPTSVVEQVGIDQKLGAQVSPDLTFRDEDGNPVRIGDYFKGDKPLVLSLVYYRCPGLCTMSLNGMSAAFKPLTLSAGKDFDVLTVSIDPRETPGLAKEKKAQYLKRYGREGAETGWHFLTGEEASVRALADAVGFRYVYHPETDQYTHSSGIMVLTPRGQVSKYYYGLEYSARDLRLGLVEASGNRIGTLADAVTLLCYQYDPRTGKYGAAVMRAVRVGGVVTVVGLAAFVFMMLKREPRAVPAASSSQTPPAPKDPVSVAARTD